MNLKIRHTTGERTTEREIRHGQEARHRTADAPWGRRHASSSQRAPDPTAISPTAPPAVAKRPVLIPRPLTHSYSAAAVVRLPHSR